MTIPIADALQGNPEESQRLAQQRAYDPHHLLGAHSVATDQGAGVVIRAYHPDADAAELVTDEGAQPMQPQGSGLFAAFLPGADSAPAYRVRFCFSDGSCWERDDPYRFMPSIGDTDVYLFNEGTHRRLYQCLGARPCVHEGVDGTAFSVWAPNAIAVSLVGEFNAWDGRLLPMRSLGSSGVWELFVPGLSVGTLYKFEVRAKTGELRVKTDPMARRLQLPPETASLVTRAEFQWEDTAWLKARGAMDIRRSPLNIYEVHLGSWLHTESGSLDYREGARRLVEHVQKLGFTHIELLPLAEHAYYPSWGYQVTGYYAPTSRYGTPDDLRYFVNYCHLHGVGVVMDWVPAHFPKDDFFLARFDGTALYEHADPRRGEHPDWGTLIFNYGRAEVNSYLISNAIYWLREFHIDGLRVDAVASMIYLDYSRPEGQWIPNEYGGRENLDAIALLRAVNQAVAEEVPGAFTVAEESTAFGGVTGRVEDGGLGFTFKWNMGWMHDTLTYFSKEPVHRKYHQDQLTFAMLYENTERFINSISHDEVVHGKGPMLDKMPGDLWQKLANLRLLYAYQALRPGKQLMFMGGEFAANREWSADHSLDWGLAETPERQALMRFVAALGQFYKQHSALWSWDPDPSSFEWIDCADRDNSVLSFLRRGDEGELVCALNFTPVPRENYRIGVPEAGRYVELLNSDADSFGGSGFGSVRETNAEHKPLHGRSHSLALNLPPLAALVLKKT